MQSFGLPSTKNIEKVKTPVNKEKVSPVAENQTTPFVGLSAVCSKAPVVASVRVLFLSNSGSARIKRDRTPGLVRQISPAVHEARAYGSW